MFLVLAALAVVSDYFAVAAAESGAAATFVLGIVVLPA